MQSRRQPPPPWERRTPYPRHPTGRVRRRWPRAYDGGLPPEEAVKRRYRRVYDGERRARQRRTGRPLTLDTLRQSPVRNGLIGLAVVGAAAPIAVNRYQTALRTDPTHERTISPQATATRMSDQTVTAAWQGMEGERVAKVDQREAAIQDYLERYAEYDLTREMAEDIYDTALQNEIDPEVAFGLVRAESSFKNTSTSHVGAVGLTQLMPRTAAWLEPGITTSDLRNPETNLRIGMKYLRQLIDKYDGDVELALTAYNRGPGTVDKVLKRGGDPDNGYAAFVFGKKNHGHKG